MLVAIREHADRAVRLVFDVSGRSVQVTADLVVLALPFSTLRDVELEHSGLSNRKRRVIRTMGMGTNAKIHLELSRKTWPALGYSGATYGEWQRLACGWDDVSSWAPTPVQLCTWRFRAGASAAPVSSDRRTARRRRAMSAGH